MKKENREKEIEEELKEMQKNWKEPYESILDMIYKATDYEKDQKHEND